MRDAEIPDTDAFEQAQSVTNPVEPLPAAKPRLSDDVPEADAFEQSQPVPLDDEEAPR